MTEEEIKQIKYEELKEEEQIISLETVKTLSNDIADKIKTLRDALEDQGGIILKHYEEYWEEHEDADDNPYSMLNTIYEILNDYVTDNNFEDMFSYSIETITKLRGK